MSIEDIIYEWLSEAQKWMKVDTRAIACACEESYNAMQVGNALRRLKRARRIEYVGPRGFGYWRTTR